MEPPELLATHLYVAQCTSCRKAPVSNFGKYIVPFSKMCRICDQTQKSIKMSPSSLSSVDGFWVALYSLYDSTCVGCWPSDGWASIVCCVYYPAVDSFKLPNILCIFAADSGSGWSYAELNNSRHVNWIHTCIFYIFVCKREPRHEQ